MTLPTTQAEARAIGAGKYAGQPCPIHPDAMRYTANARCVECGKAERRAGQVANRKRDAERKRMARAAAKAAKPFADLIG